MVFFTKYRISYSFIFYFIEVSNEKVVHMPLYQLCLGKVSLHFKSTSKMINRKTIKRNPQTYSFHYNASFSWQFNIIGRLLD